MAGTHYVDNRIYTDEAVFADEMEKIWSKVWKFCAHESELPNPGDYRTTAIAGMPLVMIRGDDGEIRTFYNVCPHRGAEIVRKPSGSGKVFTCLFHNWTFDRAGECVSIPLPDGYEDAGVSKEDQGLREVRTEVKYGLVFCNLDNDAEPLDKFLGTALDDLGKIFGSEPFELFHFHRAVLEGNWKNWVETDRELYHTFLHALNRNTSFISKGYNDREVQLYPGGHMAMMPMRYEYDKYSFSRRKARAESLPGLPPNYSYIVELFPDFVVNIKTSLARSDSVIPISPTKTIIEYRGYAPKSDSAELRKTRVNDHNEHWGPFGRNLPEDVLASAVQMKTMRDQGMPYSIFARNERGARAMDDEPMRDFYAVWGGMMDRSAHDPFGESGNAKARIKKIA